MATPATFEDLVAEAEAAPVEGWDFSWFEGRASEERPSWGYARLAGQRVEAADAVLEVETGGGEVFAEVLSRAGRLPGRLEATEGWPPNLAIARRNLAPFGVRVLQVGDADPLPQADGSFDLVVSRHPNLTVWAEIARVLAPGGIYLSQQVGPDPNRELYEFLMGPQPLADTRSPFKARQRAAAAGLVVTDLRSERPRTSFNDIGAVVHFLRKVPWTVPGFSVEAYRDRLADLHDKILEDGPFVAHAPRFLIEATKPA